MAGLKENRDNTCCGPQMGLGGRLGMLWPGEARAGWEIACCGPKEGAGLRVNMLWSHEGCRARRCYVVASPRGWGWEMMLWSHQWDRLRIKTLWPTKEGGARR